jgi:hypothetical protein
MATTALVRIGEVLPDRPLSSLEEASSILAKIRANDLAFVLTPLTNITEVKPFHKISLRMVVIDPTVTQDEKGNWKSGPHCYRSPKFMAKDEVALGKNGLMAILGAAGSSPVLTRLDDRSDPLYAEFSSLVYHQDYDGLWRQYPGHKVVDLRDGSPEAKQMTPGQLAQARQFVVSNAATKAILVALRPLFGIQNAYKEADLRRKPFVVPKLVPHWDLNDPDQKKAAIFQALGTGQQLYGPGFALGSPQVAPDGPAPTAPPVTAAAASSAPPPPAEPKAPPADAFETPDFDQPSIVVCGCPCGCQAELDPEVAERTKAVLQGVSRCAVCFPGAQFDYGRHKDLKNLSIPRWPNLTADDVKAKVSAAAKK